MGTERKISNAHFATRNFAFLLGIGLLPKMKIYALDVIITLVSGGRGAYVLRETLRSLRSLRLDNIDFSKYPKNIFHWTALDTEVPNLV